MKKIFIILILLSLATIIAVCNNSYQDKPFQKSGDKFAYIDSVIVHAINDSAFPGAVVLVSQNGEVIYEKGFGHFTYDESSHKFSTTTIYDIASLTKVVATTTAAMICIDRNLFQLDDSLRASCLYYPAL